MPSGVYRSHGNATYDHNASTYVRDQNGYFLQGHSPARVVRHGSARDCGDVGYVLSDAQPSDSCGAIDGMCVNANGCALHRVRRFVYRSARSDALRRAVPLCYGLGSNMIPSQCRS